jgi:hypothetical protein
MISILRRENDISYSPRQSFASKSHMRLVVADLAP